MNTPAGSGTRITGALRRVRQRPSTLEVDAVQAAVQDRLFRRHDGAPHLGRYRLRRRLGAGGLGVVFEAHDPELDRSVAIKLMRRHDWLTDDDLERFEREAAAMARVNHPNVVAVFDVGRYDRGDVVAAADADVEVPDAGIFIVMERVEGVDLKQWLQSPRTPAEILQVFEAAGRGLAAAHAAEIVHRDFKPQNVIVTGGSAKVLDFGLARLEGATESGAPAEVSLDGRSSTGSSSSLTRPGVVMGTPAYMAPEQHAGEIVDARADQYAFCVALAEALLGRRLFEGDTIEALHERKRAFELKRDPKLDRRRRAALRRGLQARPDDRFASMDALLSALAPARRWVRGGSLALVALGGVAALALAAGSERVVSTMSPVVVADLSAAMTASPPPDPDRFRRDDILAHDDIVGELIGEGRNHELVAMAEVLRTDARAAGDPLLQAWAGYWACHGYMRLEDYRAGAEACEEAYEIGLGMGHGILAAKSAMMAGANYARDHDPTALLWQRHAVAQVERGALEPRHAAYVLDGVGNILEQFGQDSSDVMRRGIELREQAEGPDSPALVAQLHNYVRYLVRWERMADAEPVARRMLDIAVRALPESAIERTMAEQDLGEVLCETGRAEEGLPHLDRAVEIFEAHFIDVHPAGLAFALDVRARCLASLKRWSDAITSAERALEIHRSSAVRRHGILLESLVSIARWHARAGDRPAARAAYRAALDVVDPDEPNPPLRAKARTELRELALERAPAAEPTPG